MTRAFDDDLMAALAQPVTNLALCVRIVRKDGTHILFAQASEALTTLDEYGQPQTFPQARGVTVATIPFELNGAATRADLNIISTDGGTIDVGDIENGLYDNAAVTITLVSRNPGVAATTAFGAIAFHSQPTAGPGISIEGQEIDFVTSGANQTNCLIGTNLAATMTNLINLLQTSILSSIREATYSLDSVNNIINITDVTPGAIGNSFRLFVFSGANATPAGFSTLSGGADAVFQTTNVLFSGLMGQMTLTERGYATIEMVGHLERAKQFITEVFTPVCRADFGDARCKVNLNGNDGAGNPITQHVKFTGYDGGYKITVSGLNTVAAGAVGAKAKGKITFFANPSTFVFNFVSINDNPSVILNGTQLFLRAITTPTDQAYGVVGSDIVASTLVGTLGNLLNFLTHSKDPNLALMAYNVDATNLYVTAASEGSYGNAFSLAVGVPGGFYPPTPATASGPFLTGGFGKGGYFLNGQIIFRSGLLLNEAYEIQNSESSIISLFTPLEFAPEYGDLVDIIQGCDHSPFVGGCARFPDPATGLAPNINNYRGEPWAPGDAINPCQAAPSALPITGIPKPIEGGPGAGAPTPDDDPPGLWAPYITILAAK